MPRLNLPTLLQSLSIDAVRHPRDLVATLAARHGVSRSTVTKALRGLIDAGWLERDGRTRPTYRPGRLRQVVRSYPLAGLDEHTPWRTDYAPAFDLPVNVRRIVQHAYTELLNNAIDHSGGSRVDVSMRVTATHVHLLVADDGVGVFQRIGDAFGIADPQAAMLELAKGKLTTQGDRHSGRGLFFTSRLADVFDLHANALAFQHRLWTRRDWLRNHPLHRPGTAVFFSIALDSDRSLEQVMRAHSVDASAIGFQRTVVPLRLLTTDTMPLVSRAQARRVLSRLEHFALAELDFDGVDHIGQAFADEVFRVFPARHPEVTLAPLNMNAAVAAMVRGVDVRLAA